MAITLADFNKIWASTSPLTPYSFSESNYKQGWNFIGSTPPARQMWDYIQKNNDEKMQYLANNYLPLSGGTMTGTINVTNGTSMKGASDTLYVGIYNNTGGGGFITYGTNNSGRPGFLQMVAKDSSQTTVLEARPNGTLTWGGNNVLTAVNYSNYALPLSGGTMTGDIRGNVGSFRIYSAYTNSSGNIVIYGGANGANNGASVQVHGKNSTGGGGFFNIEANNGSNSKMLQGRPNGTLTWDGQPIQTSSDKRLKQDFADVPDDVLEAWGKVNWQQFKYIDDAERKGVNNCRFHTGLVAQDVKEVGEANNVDLLKYGILCHDVREAVEEEKDENGNVIKEASEAVDLWTVRYEEALAMEVIYLRNEIKKLREEIKSLRTE